MKKPLLILFALLLVNCSKEALFIDSEIDRLNTFRDLWEAQGIDSYEMTQEVSCFCASDFRFPKRLTIENNRLVAVNGGPFDEQFPNEFMTIEEAFNFIEDRLFENPATARIFYDGTFGFPYTFYFDMDLRIADEEIGYSFSDFYIID